MTKLTYKRRQKLPKKDFAIPEKAPGPGSYPIDTKKRARNALARVSTFGTEKERRRVQRAVHRRYPGIRITPPTPRLR